MCKALHLHQSAEMGWVCAGADLSWQVRPLEGLGQVGHEKILCLPSGLQNETAGEPLA